MREDTHLIDALGSALQHGGAALGDVPELLKQVLSDGVWREFTTRRGQHVTHERFAEFVSTPPLAGLGSDVDLIRRIVSSDVEAADLLDQALQNAPARHAGKNIPSRPEGTSQAKALRRLRKDAPQLHAEVLAGHLSAHAAMVRAGYRPKTFTVRADSAASVVATLRRQLPPEQLGEVARLLRLA